MPLTAGVGRTDEVFAASFMLSAELGTKVLVIDLDPQTNPAVRLILSVPCLPVHF